MSEINSKRWCDEAGLRPRGDRAKKTTLTIFSVGKASRAPDLAEIRVPARSKEDADLILRGISEKWTLASNAHYCVFAVPTSRYQEALGEIPARVRDDVTVARKHSTQEEIRFRALASSNAVKRATAMAEAQVKDLGYRLEQIVEIRPVSPEREIHDEMAGLIHYSADMVVVFAITPDSPFGNF